MLHLLRTPFVAVSCLAAVFAAAIASAWNRKGSGRRWGNGQGRGHGHGVPELDPGLAGSAITLPTCGVLLLTSKLRRKYRHPAAECGRDTVRHFLRSH